MKKLFISILAFLFIFQISFAEHSPKRELRATWLATVWRLDWPSVTVPANGSDSQRQAAIAQQKSELINILDRMKAANMNTLFFQIRSMCDAMYPSSFENWSSYISSERGADPGWDPLGFAVEEAHKRGMELHAWFNPYRYATSDANYSTLPNDYAVTNPEWLISYNNGLRILNPGIPEVTKRITDIVAEVLKNYDVDGIVFDDYFYGNGMTTNAHDQAQYNAYNPNGLLRADWRRENCNSMIKAVYDTIQSIKSWVTFGVSPAGVAASDPAVAAKYGVPPAPVGTDWQYNGIYADPLAWLQQGSIDYISPQIYWTTTSGLPYHKLAAWWSMVANKFSKHFYSSHSISAMTGGGSTTEPFSAPAAVPAAPKNYTVRDEVIPEVGMSGLEKQLVSDYMTSLSSDNNSMQKVPAAINFDITEVGLQVAANRDNDLNGAPGSVLYSTKKAMGATFLDYMKKNVYTRPSIQPAIHWKNAPQQNLANNLFVSGNELSWTHDKNDVKYAIYAVPVGEYSGQNLFSTSAYLIGVSYSKKFTLPAGISSLTHKLAVTVLDRYRNETSVRILGEPMGQAVAAQLIYPENNSEPIIPAVFKWSAVEGADSYVWEVATDKQFKNLICARETADNQFPSVLQNNILENTTYYWRVKTRKANAPDIYSEVFSFKGEKFKILSPVNGATGVSLTPTFEWTNISTTAEYTLEINTNALFAASGQVFSQTTNQTNFKLPENVLLSETDYFARVKVNDDGVQVVSEAISFKTLELEIPVPTIINPEDSAVIYATELTLEWAEQNSKGFMAELSKSTSFPPRGTTLIRTDAFTFEAKYKNLTEGTYYLRVKALNNAGTTEPSPYITVVLKKPMSIDKNEVAQIKTYLDKESRLHIHLGNIDAKITANVYNLTGTLVYSEIFTTFKSGNDGIIINLQNYPKGIYILKITAGNYSRAVKINKKW